MNISDFISEEEFNEILKKAEEKECFEFSKEINIKGNFYNLTIHGSFDYKNNYHIFPDFNYNYKDKAHSSGRSIGGGSLVVDCSNWDNFKQGFEERLKKYPDYEENVQISLF